MFYLTKLRTLELNDFDRVVLLPNPEDFEVAEDRLLGLSVTVNLDTQEVALVLPVELTLRDVEQVLLPEDIPAREVDDRDTRRLVRDLGCPVRQHVLLGLLARLLRLLCVLPVLVAVWAPLEVRDALNLDGLLVV